MAWDVEFYETESGGIPAKEFIDGLDVKLRAKAARDITLLQGVGSALREPYSKSMGGGLFELRIKSAGDIARIFYFFFVGNKIILTSGFIKKTMKTPPRELEKARKYKADYERRAQT
ncbi:MAG: type II toxin-antitoxin system RelE/ParE family toxin [Ruminococcaceae bacterium]|jgi:phage-related protein|nr:type II toxin-antitoxin system RelE/ParE family toxin [Oscillospiraceae bacterium]